MKKRTKLPLSIAELRDFMSVDDPAVRAEIIRTLDKAVECECDVDEVITPDQYADSHEATRKIVDKLRKKAESLRRNRLKRKARKESEKAAKAWTRPNQPLPDIPEEDSAGLLRSDAAKIKQIIRHRDAIRSVMIDLFVSLARQNRSAALIMIARSIEVAIDFAVEMDSRLLSSEKRHTSALVPIPTIEDLSAPFADPNHPWCQGLQPIR